MVPPGGGRTHNELGPEKSVLPLGGILTWSSQAPGGLLAQGRNAQRVVPTDTSVQGAGSLVLSARSGPFCISGQCKAPQILHKRSSALGNPYGCTDREVGISDSLRLSPHTSDTAFSEQTEEGIRYVAGSNSRLAQASVVSSAPTLECQGASYVTGEARALGPGPSVAPSTGGTQLSSLNIERRRLINLGSCADPYEGSQEEHKQKLAKVPGVGSISRT